MWSSDNKPVQPAIMIFGSVWCTVQNAYSPQYSVQYSVQSFLQEAERVVFLREFVRHGVQ